VVEKIHGRIADMLAAGEHVEYIAVQKKPIATPWPDSITVSNRRIFLCEFAKFGLVTHFEIFRWNDIEDMDFREGFFGTTVTLVPAVGENLIIDYIPKVQARRLYQIIKDALVKPADPPSEPKPKIGKTEGPALPQPEKNPEKISPKIPLEIVRPTVPEQEEPKPEEPKAVPTFSLTETGPPKREEDERTLKLEKLYHRQLITKAEYESKKAELLVQKRNENNTQTIRT